MAASVIKSIHLVIWRYKGGEKDEWDKLAVISPDEGAAKAPIVHLANDGGHYMPLIQENFKKSNKDHLQGKKVWKSTCVTSVHSETSHDHDSLFRGAGDKNGNIVNQIFDNTEEEFSSCLPDHDPIDKWNQQKTCLP